MCFNVKKRVANQGYKYDSSDILQNLFKHDLPEVGFAAFFLYESNQFHRSDCKRINLNANLYFTLKIMLLVSLSSY